MLKRKENFKCDETCKNNQQVLYSLVNINYVYSYKKLYSRYIINRNFSVKELAEKLDYRGKMWRRQSTTEKSSSERKISSGRY